MPTYEYRCERCGATVEVVQSFTDAPLTECDACGGALRKVFAPVGIVFKGSGFYKTDSRSSRSGSTSTSGGTTSDAGTSSSDGKAATDGGTGSPTKATKDGSTSGDGATAGAKPEAKKPAAAGGTGPSAP